MDELKKIVIDCSTGEKKESYITQEDKKQVEPITPQPTKEELQAKKIEELEKQLATCQQSIVELTALAAMRTP